MNMMKTQVLYLENKMYRKNDYAEKQISRTYLQVHDVFRRIV